MGKYYLNENQVNVTIDRNDEQVYGSTGVEVVTVAATGMFFNEHVEKIVLSGSVADYQFLQLGNRLFVYDGATVVTQLIVQGDDDGTLITFDNGTARAEYDSESAIWLGGVKLSSLNAGSITPVVGDSWEPAPVETGGTVLNVNGIAYPGEEAVGADVDGEADIMRLTGDMGVRIDFSDPGQDNQITGLDLDGSGAINQNGVENRITGVASGFEVVDAYARDPWDTGNLTDNFLGDINFDGTGVGGDGVSSDGAIFLGGLGADTARVGIGNDFLAGGGVAEDGGMDRLYGGRNADFFFASLSDLSTTDGDSLKLDGGQTTDDAAVSGDTAMDSDWLLLEVADDEDGTVIDLRIDGTSTGDATGQTVISGNDASRISMNEIENVDASGNLYGFLNAIDVALGENGQVINGENVAIGASSQLHIIGGDSLTENGDPSGEDDVNNIFIGGYDNDRLEGGGGNDLLFGGNLHYAFNNPNAVGIVNDGSDELIGGRGNDNIVFEVDGGIIDGGTGEDTLWLTDLSLGTQAVTDLTADGVLRFDLLSQTLANAAGYGGADVDGTQDQTNYAGSGLRVTMTNMESVIATGLGAVDYLAAGSNDPELVFNNQQNHFAYNGDLDLRGTDLVIGDDSEIVSTGINTLYAAGGQDVLEGRGGGTLTFDNEGNVISDDRDKLSGGDQNDQFIFSLEDADGVDVIHRQTNLDVDGDGAVDNLTDGTFEQDFGMVTTNEDGKSYLYANFPDTVDLTDPNVGVTQFEVTIDGVVFGADLDSADLSGLETTAELAEVLNTAFGAVDFPVSVTVEALDENTIRVVVDEADAEIGTTLATGTVIAGTAVGAPFQVNPTLDFLDPTVSGDTLIYASYEDRADGELVDDDSYTGSTISLGADSYAEDLVIDFAADGTRIAEDQQYVLTFTNLTTEDTVTITVNGVNYTLTVGVDLDGNEIAGEELTTQGGAAATQALIQKAFLTRMGAFINTFMDDDTAAGQVGADTNDVYATTIVLTQVDYNGEETVFMRTPTVAIVNDSHGEGATATVMNVSDHEVQLLDFDGRGGLLNENNVLFIGDNGIDNSRAVLETGAGAAGDANTMSSSEAVIVDGGANTLQATVFGTTQAIADNTATNSFLRADFTVHGDDLLVTGEADDTVNAGTGDDRVIGSTGDDVIDGGKSYYAVQVLGEPQARVYVLNQWQAENPVDVAELDGLTISSISRIGDVEGGNAGPNNAGVAEVYDDTLQFEQKDFVAGATAFTITLNDYDMVGGEVQMVNGGAGTVSVDLDGNGGAFDSVTTFTNFENIRTVSGIGNAVADDGQGHDTLDVTLISNVIGGASGVSYDLTGDASAGEVRYSTDAHADLTNPDEADFDALMIRVDGVENVTSGTGDDLLLIDETEAAKDNVFTAGLGDDRIEYQNQFNTIAAEPTLTIRVNTATDTDLVEMTAGRVGTTVATDTLVGVEVISLTAQTAQGVREDDVLDVTELSAGAIVNYNDVLIENAIAGTPGTIRELDGDLQLTIENMFEIENVIADGDDTVILADAAVMSQNARTDAVATDLADIQIDSFLNFDLINEDDLSDRLSLVELASGIEDVAQGPATDLPQTVNFGQFHFSMSEVGTDDDNDTIDYSQTVDSIAAVVNFDADQDTQYVLVDGDGDATFDAIDDDDADRVDEIVSAENIVAAQGESILDLTGATQNLRISYSNNFDVVADWDGNYNVGYGREIHEIKVASATTGTSVVSMNFIDYKFIDTDTANLDPVAANATWTSIEGSDYNETVDLSGWEADAINTLNLRGGDNQVNYEGDSVEIVIDVVDYDDTNPAATGLVVVDATHTAPGDDHDATTVDADVSAVDVITSYSAQNEIAAGSLTIKGARGDLDVIEFAAGLGSKFFILGGVTDATSSITVTIDEAAAANSLELVGFETLRDSDTDDTYRIDDLGQVLADLTFTDNIANDRDTIQVFDDVIGEDSLGYNAAINEISLEVLNDLFAFDFDVLDITNVTDNDIIISADSDVARDITGGGNGADDVVVGNLDLLTSVNGFEDIYFTNASITSAGSTYVLDITGSQLEDSNSPLFITDATGLNFSRVTTGVTVSVIETAVASASIVGSQAADDITGGAGDDTIFGGAGADTLDGGSAAEIRQIQLAGILDAPASAAAVTLTMGSGLGAVVLTLNESLAPADVDATDGTLDILAGSGSDAVGVALANLVNANIADINAVVGAFTDGANDVDLLSASYDSGTDLLTFTFASGADVVVGDTIAFAVNAADLGTLAGSADTTITDGGDGGVDTFGFEATAAANGADSISAFEVGAAGDVLDFSLFIDLAKTYEEVATVAGDITTNANVIVYGGTTTIAAAAAAIAADATVTGAKGVIVISNGTDTFIYESSDLGANGTETLVATLVGVADPLTLDTANFVTV